MSLLSRAGRPGAGTVLLMVLLMLMAGCGTRSSGAAHVRARTAGASAQIVGVARSATVAALSTLPPVYGPITRLVGSPAGAGVWFWASTVTTVRVFNEKPGGKIRSWQILGGASYKSGQVTGGFAVTRSGVAWLALNSTLARLSTATGTVRTWAIPTPRSNPRAEQYLPPPLRRQGFSYAQALAVAPAGQVAIAMANASSVTIFNPATRQFSAVPLPARYQEPISLAYSANNTLAVGLANFVTHRSDSAYLRPATGRAVIVTGADSWSLTPYGPGSFILGSSVPYVVTTVGPAKPVRIPLDPLDRSGTGSPIAVLPGGKLASIGFVGAIEFPADAASDPAAAGEAADLVPPEVRCGPAAGTHPGPAGPPGRPRPPARSSVCEFPRFQQMASDAAGDIWFVVGGRTVGMLSPSPGP